MRRARAAGAVGVAAAGVVVLAGCLRYALSPEDEASARLGAKITKKVMGLDAGEEERRQVLLGEVYRLFECELQRYDAGDGDSGVICRQPPRKDAGK